MPQSNFPAENMALLTELRGKDYERYLFCLFAPAAARPDWAALFLFNAELAQIRDQVTEPLLGRIRLQWWQDALGKLGAAEQPPHRLLTALAGWRQSGIDLTPFNTLIAARMLDMEAEPFAAEADYAAYRRDTSQPLAAVAAQLCGLPTSAADFAAIMNDYATIGLLRAMPHWLQQRRMPLPPDMLAANKIDGAALAEMRPQAALGDWARRAAHELAHKPSALRDLARSAKHAAMPVLLNQAMTQFHARAIERSGGNILRPVTQSALRLPYLFWRSLRG